MDAIFPRILIHSSIIAKLRNDSQSGGSVFNELISSRLLLQDGEAMQLHVLDDENWNTVYLSFKKIYEESRSSVDKNGQLRLKHTWLQNYLFAFKPKGNRKSRYISEFTPLEN